MLTTYHLETLPRHAIDFGDKVRFNLVRGYELHLFDHYEGGIVERSANPNTNRSVTGTIRNMLPQQPGELEINLVLDDGTDVRLKITQCRALKILD